MAFAAVGIYGVRETEESSNSRNITRLSYSEDYMKMYMSCFKLVTGKHLMIQMS